MTWPFNHLFYQYTTIYSLAPETLREAVERAGWEIVKIKRVYGNWKITLRKRRGAA